MLNLSSDRRYPGITHHRQLLARGPSLDPTAPAVVTDAIASVIIRDIVVVEIANPGGIHISDRAVIVNRTVIPISAVVASAGISIAVIDAAVVADMRSPIA